MYYIPKLESNIISLGQMTEVGNTVVLAGSYLKMWNSSGALLMKVKRTPNRLYKLLLEIGQPVCLMASLADLAWLWHARLGHVNFYALKMMGEKEMAFGVPKIEHPNQLCECCMVAKQARVPFPIKAKFRAQRPLQLVHADLCGPITPATLAGNKYFFLLVDDYSRWMWVYTLKEKSGAFEVFKKFKRLVENRSGHRLKTLRTD